MPKISEAILSIEEIAPLAYQESYDNSGLLTGNKNDEIKGILISFDCTEPVIEEAIQKGCNLIVCHHPIIFGGLKKLNGKNYVERTVIAAIKNDIAIYAAHTNLDNINTGVNKIFADKIGLQNIEILSPKKNTLTKLTTFVPKSHSKEVREALNQAGAGTIGNYKNCSFSLEGEGTFQPNEKANPYIGVKNGELETVEEVRIEVIIPSHQSNTIVTELKKAHPYEEVAYYLQDLENYNQEVGSGMIGTLKEPLTSNAFLNHLKDKLDLELIRFTEFGKPIKKVAICGGAGSFLLGLAKAKNADAFVTGDFKYHEFFDAENQLMIADIGHYESEVNTKDFFYELLSKKISNIAINLSEINTNPVQYFK